MTLADSVAKATHGRTSRDFSVVLDHERAVKAVADGLTPHEAIEQARWMIRGFDASLAGFRRGWNLEGHNWPAWELVLWSLERDLAVAMTDPQFVPEVEALLAEVNAPLMQLATRVNEGMSRVHWIRPDECLASEKQLGMFEEVNQ